MSSEPTKQVEPEHVVTGEDNKAAERLTAGTLLDHGRYRLLSQVGSDVRSGAQLWRAKDGVLGRDVALTILVGDRSDSKAAADARRTLERAMHASTFNHVGVARVLDVVAQSPGDPPTVLGIVIAEWTHGTDLLDVVADGPLPPGTAARLLQPLAAAVEAAHHAGLVLGADHPQRIRVTPDGEIRMAFPGPLAKATSSEDVRGLGAALYLLLTGRWPLPDGPAGLPAAPTDAEGEVVPPRTLRPTVPMELSTVSLRALGSPDSTGTTGGVRTGAAVLRVLEQHASNEAVTNAMAVSDNAENEVWSTEDPKPDQQTRKKLMVSVGVLSVATVLVLGWLVTNLIGMFWDTKERPGTQIQVDDEGKPSVQAPVGPIAITGGVSYAMGGNDPDDPDDIPHMFDGDPNTTWDTFDYKQQLGPGGLTEGTGVMLTLANPAAVREVVITSPTPGTHVEIRAVPDGQPSKDTSPLIGQSTLGNGATTIPVKADQPIQNILVFLTELPSSGGSYTGKIGEVTVNGSAA